MHGYGFPFLFLDSEGENRVPVRPSRITDLGLACLGTWEQLGSKVHVS
jgi:hypothetical protein